MKFQGIVSLVIFVSSHYVVFSKVLLLNPSTENAPPPNVLINTNNVKTVKTINSGNRVSDQENLGCAPFPKLSVESQSRNSFKPNSSTRVELLHYKNGKEYFSLFEAIIVLKCENYGNPVEFIYEGAQEPSIKPLTLSRIGSQGQCYRILLKLKTTKSSTGKYTCRELKNYSKSSSIYIYGDANSPPELLYHGKSFETVENPTLHQAILPCQVVNPTVRPKLTKGNTDVIQIQQDSSSVKYNPQIGYTIDLNKIPKPYDTYVCSVGDDKVSTKVNEKLFDFSPSTQSVAVVSGQTVILQCTGLKIKVGLQGYIYDPKTKVGNNSVSYELNPKIDTDITCINLETKQILHTWNVVVISKEANENSGISYDPTTGKFTCLSKTIESPAISMVECNSPVECELADKCFTWKEKYTIVGSRDKCYSKIYRGTPCKKTDINDIPIGCSTVSLASTDVSAGVVYCFMQDDEQQRKLAFFKGVDKNHESVITNYQTSQVSDLIKFIPTSSEHNNLIYYAGDFIEFECTVRKFLFAEGLKFLLEYDNGTLSEANETLSLYANNFEDREEDSLITKIGTIWIEESLKKIYCSVPFWNSTEWMNRSLEISVKASSGPKVISPLLEEPIKYSVGSEEKLICEAEGIPSPTVIWYYEDGKKVHNQKQEYDSSTYFSNSTIDFGIVDEDDEGTYFCVAYNIVGNETKNVTVIVEVPASKTLYTILGIGSLALACFIFTISILWKKLKKEKATVRRLTEKEVIEFREGDIDQRLAPDGYIRAQYLPYDKDYEIKQENLEIDSEIVLGKGEYGMVYKGTLKHNEYRKIVAVKTIRSSDVNHFKALLSELKILTYIGWHDNVINLLGAVTRNIRDRDVKVVVEYCRLGDLESFLRSNKNSFLNQIVNDDIDLNLTFSVNSALQYQPVEYSIRTADLICWSYQIASGMEYLANKKVIHGDLAPRNILLTDDRTVKITDFGLSKHLQHDSSNYTSRVALDLPWKLCAPEIFQYNSVFSTHSDVWAYGVTLWEIYSLGESPYPGIQFNWDFKNRLLQGYRMSQPGFANTNIYNVMLKCWKNVPEERISFPELRKYFHWLLHHWNEKEMNNIHDLEDDDEQNSNLIPNQLNLSKTANIITSKRYMSPIELAVHYKANSNGNVNV